MQMKVLGRISVRVMGAGMHWCQVPGGSSHLDMVYVYVPAFGGAFSQNLV